MRVKEYEQFGETLYTLVLPNGLKVNMLPRPNFHKTYGILTTNYGSLDSTFAPLDKDELCKVPDGIAHFLEHKLFEKKNYDAFDLFGKYGADANAYTSFTRTSYLFSATKNVKECLDILLDFVQTPYFSDETVAKEKGIIGQEIKMYDDDPNWRLFFGMLGNLYPNTPLSVDIAGSVESIAQITPELLYTCYNAFYQPSNMNLFIVGRLDVEELTSWIEKNQSLKDFPSAQKIQRVQFENTLESVDIIPYRMIELDVQRPKTMVGIRGLDVVPEGRDGLKYKLTIDLLLYLLYSESSKNYLELYKRGILDDSFGYEFQIERGFHFAVISGDTKNPQELSNEIIGIAENAQNILVNQQSEFQLAQRELIGRYITSMNSLESIANQYAGDLFEDATIFDVVPIIEKITLDDIKKVAQDFIRSEAVSVYQVLPKEDVK
ncbi:insulinase family protein [Ligilactobacillus sp. WILCCON 0076]|uniref:Insulinase family protein n=1 Tax=Ligilactobacillus ubinensis TaxID=2876789 RepID=A0A9X2JMB2_9LACO|nr:pitrilysin family protein [Ligilactobacillus ubinensis]MCP0887729.1 insulinase family protein [Ligilactobacillus ubinensis]